jgi:antitoxin HigA-1
MKKKRQVACSVESSPWSNADTAVRLARFFGTSPELWMNAQSFYEVRRAQNELAKELSRIEPREAA